ncbi:hypothetical protein EDB89DRAFT_747658 [Lactarius sanguifluus]|nr:hypothetical protein EDB89DRAFT_747658 [Lactarius sanguifluus]
MPIPRSPSIVEAAPGLEATHSGPPRTMVWLEMHPLTPHWSSDLSQTILMLPSITQRCRLLGRQSDSILFAFYSYGTRSCPDCTHPIVLRYRTNILLSFGFVTIAACTVLDTSHSLLAIPSPSSIPPTSQSWKLLTLTLMTIVFAAETRRILGSPWVYPGVCSPKCPLQNPARTIYGGQCRLWYHSVQRSSFARRA